MTLLDELLDELGVDTIEEGIARVLEHKRDMRILRSNVSELYDELYEPEVYNTNKMDA